MHAGNKCATMSLRGCDPCDPAECVSSEKPGTGPAHRGTPGEAGEQNTEPPGFCLDLDESCPKLNVPVVTSTSAHGKPGREAPASCSDYINPDSDTWQTPSQGGRTRLASRFRFTGSFCCGATGAPQQAEAYPNPAPSMRSTL